MPPAALDIRLPRFSTPFIGRQDEITQLIDLLNRDTCCLLTFTGPGGSGKTRLAIEVANQLDFADGVYFVPLQPLRSADNIVNAIVDALPLQLRGDDGPAQQLLNYLRNRQLLLILDNFEHLLEGVDLVTNILEAATHVKLLVTSRERLNLQAEQVWPVQGLAVPGNDSVGLLDQHSAVQLFVERARRVQPVFTFEAQHDAVVRICRLVDGLPLALELAASWVQMMSCEAISGEIQHNIDILETSQHDVPERHQSMRAVFNYSWRRLSEDERQIFQRLTIFRDGFTAEAAEFVAEASVESLRILVGKSLLWPEPTVHRYSIHELLRQYAEEHLQQTPDDMRRVNERHCEYYINLLYQLAPALRSGEQRRAIKEISSDLDNVRAAWIWAVEQHDFAALDTAAYSLQVFHQYSSTYLQGAQALQYAVDRLEDNVPAHTQAHLLNMLGWISLRLSRFEQCRDVFQRSLRIMNRTGITPRPGMATDPLPGLSLIASIQGDHETATRLGREALTNNEARDDPGNLMMSSYVLVSTYFAQGQYQDAQYHAQWAYDIAEEQAHHWFMALCLNDLGKIARVLEHFDIAEKHHWNSYNISQDFGDNGGMAGSLIHLGEVALSKYDYAAASAHYHRSLEIYEVIGDPAGLAAALAGMGQIACLQALDTDAQHYYDRALRTAWVSRLIPLTLDVLEGVAEYYLHVHLPGRAIILLSLILVHPSTSQETQDSAREILQAANSALKSSDGNFADFRHYGRSLELEAVVTKLRMNFSHAFENDDYRQAEKPLLSNRELEVLQLIAKGSSNQQIAHALNLSVGTVRSTHVTNICRKLDAQNRTEAVARAHELGLIN